MGESSTDNLGVNSMWFPFKLRFSFLEQKIQANETDEDTTVQSVFSSVVLPIKMKYDIMNLPELVTNDHDATRQHL